VVAGKFEGSGPPQVMTRRDVEVESRLESIERYGETGVDRSLSMALRASVLDRIIDESVIMREVVRLGRADVEQEEIDRAYGDLAESVGGEDVLNGHLGSLGFSEGEVDEILSRRIVTTRYVVDWLRLTTSWTDDELMSLFLTMDHPWVGRDFQEVKAEFREYALEVRALTYRDELVEDLANRCRIWVFWQPGEAEGP